MKSSLKTNPKELKAPLMWVLSSSRSTNDTNNLSYNREKSAHNYVLIMKIYEQEKSNRSNTIEST